MKKLIYKITYPNGKIYIGKDLTGTLTYFGSVNSRLVAADFSLEQQADFVIRKQILYQSSCDRDLAKAEIQLILENGSNNPHVGYNRSPKYRALGASGDQAAEDPQAEKQPAHTTDNGFAHEGANRRVKQQQADDQHHNAEKRRGNSEGFRHAINEAAEGIAEQSKEAAEAFDNETNHRAEGLAE